MAFEDYEQTLILWIAPRAARERLEIILRLDARLRTISGSAREPILEDIKRAWWREQLVALDPGAHPAEPLLQAVSEVLGHGVTGALLSGLADADTRDEALRKAVMLVCGGTDRPYHLAQTFADDDARRAAAGRPLASPARRTLIAIRMRLIGR